MVSQQRPARRGMFVLVGLGLLTLSASLQAQPLPLAVMAQSLDGPQAPARIIARVPPHAQLVPGTEFDWDIVRQETNEEVLTGSRENNLQTTLAEPGHYTITARAITPTGEQLKGQTVLTLQPGLALAFTIVVKAPNLNRPPATYTFQVKDNLKDLKTKKDRLDRKSMRLAIVNIATGEVLTEIPGANQFRYTFEQPGDFLVVATGETEQYHLRGEANYPLSILPNLPPVIDDFKISGGGEKNRYDIIVNSHDDDGRITETLIQIGKQNFNRNHVKATLEATGKVPVKIVVTDNSGSSVEWTREIELTDGSAKILPSPLEDIPSIQYTAVPGTQTAKLWLPTPPKDWTYTVETADDKTFDHAERTEEVTGSMTIPLNPESWKRTVRIRYKNEEGEGPWSIPTTITVLTAVPPTVTPVGNGLRIQWPPIPEGLQAEVVYRKTGDTPSTIQSRLAPRGAPELVLTPLDPDVQYQIALIVTDGIHRSWPSTVVTGQPILESPNAPAIPALSEDDDRQEVVVSLEPPPSGARYRVRHHDELNQEPVTVVIDQAEQTRIRLPLADGTTTKSVQLQLVNRKGPSPWSAWNTIPVLTRPKPPRLIPTSMSDLLIKWPSLDPGQQAQVRVAPLRGPATARAILRNLEGDSVRLTDLIAGTDYVVSLALRIGPRKTKWSDNAQITMPNPPSPTGLQGELDHHQLVLEWTNVVGATGYEIGLSRGPQWDARNIRRVFSNISEIVLPNVKPSSIWVAVRTVVGKAVSEWSSPLEIHVTAPLADLIPAATLLTDPLEDNPNGHQKGN